MKKYGNYSKALCSGLFLFFILVSVKTFSQTEQRIKFTSIKSSINTGQDYSPWMNDDTTDLVQYVWQGNFVWVDLTLPLTQRSKVSRLSFYDYEGTFEAAPDTIYALNGKTRTFLGTFTGPNYMTFDGFTLATPVQADAIIIRKYCNSIPQKVRIYGQPDVIVTTPPVTAPTTPVTTAPTPPAVKPPVTLPGLADDPTMVKIPIDPTRWYQLTNATDGLEALTDGVTDVNVNTGYGKLIENYDAFYPVLPGERIDLYKIRLFSYQGSLGDKPLTISVIDNAGNRTVVGSFVGGVYNTWIGPYPSRPTQFVLDSMANNIKYIVLNCWSQFPTEMELYGHYAAPLKTQLTKATPQYPLNQYFGVNAFEWNFEDPNNPLVVNGPLMAAMQSFTQVRHYMDWQKLESTQGNFTYNPVHSGGWNYDAMYRAAKTNNMMILADLKTQPDWMKATWPSDQQDSENVPVMYGKDFADPNSYLEQAKAAFQYAARYGSNSSVASSSLSVDTTTRWTDDPKNQVKKGMGLVHYIECDNERDKWWKGRNAYQTSYEYAANMSAFYDGNKNTMGPGAGVKNADPNMMVVMGGLCSDDPSYVHGMIEWCKQHRGYKGDGSVNLCWDVINYHYYSSDANGNGYQTTGLAPELTNTLKIAQNFVSMSHQYANDMPVWVTESGYDVNQGSPQKAPPIGSKTSLQVEADWVLRTSLLFARAGIERLFFYEAYDDNIQNPTQYASSGLINSNKSRRPAADFMFQVNKVFGNYVYQETLNSDPIVDRYQYNGQQAYVLTIPDQKGRTASYSLSMPLADSAYIYIPVAGVTDMNVKKIKLVNNAATINVTETPTFVIPVISAVSGIGQLLNKTLTTVSNDSFNNSINVYPNPTAKFITVAYDNPLTSNVTIKVTDVNMARVYQTHTYQKTGDNFSNTIDISNVPMGVCIVQVTQGSLTTMRKVIKTY